jgi:hypothetical protein
MKKKMWQSTRSIEDQAFLDGANGVPKEHGLREIQGQCDRNKAALRKKAAPEIQKLEAHAQTLRALADEAQEHWQAVKGEQGTDLPRLFLSLLLLAASALAVAAEAFLLAPMLDMIGVADPQWQLVTAVGIVTGAAILIHFCLLRRERQPEERWPLAVTAGVIVGLAFLGLLRAQQMAFAAIASGSLFGQFLKAHVWLSRAVMVFLTLLFPVAATLVPHSSLEELHKWWQYRRARNRAEKLARRANHAEKERDGRKEKLAHELAEVDEQAKEWKAVYETFHALGAEVGATRPPRWTVWAKASALAVVIFVLALAAAYSVLGSFTLLSFLLAVLLATAAWVLGAVYFYRRWEHPSAKGYRKMARLKFRDGEPRELPTETPATAVEPLPQESHLPQPVSSGNGRSREVS